MFKKLSSSLVLAGMLFGTNLFAVEGKYITLSEPIPNAENSVYEVWSYRCTHCFSHHKAGTMVALQNQLPDTTVGYLIVKTMGDYGKQAADILAYAEAKDIKEGRKLASKDSLYHKVSDAYFKAYFNKKQRWDNGASPDKFYDVGLKALGISKADLDAFLSTEEAKTILAKQDIADAISKNLGTPGFVVNGKYEIDISKIKSVDELIQVAKELLKK